MTKAQYEHEKLRLAREKQLRILAEAQTNANPWYVIRAAEFWLERWRGQRSPLLKRKPESAPMQVSARVTYSVTEFSLST